MRIDGVKYIKGRKSIGIQVKEGRVYVSAPRGISEPELNSALKSKEGWIDKKLAEYDRARRINSDIIAYRSFLLFGERHNFTGGRFVPCGSAQEPANDGLVRSGAELKRAEKEYLKCAAAFLPEFLREISASSGLRYASVRLTRSKAKWGSCNDKGIITLNWRLVMLPKSIIGYIILHELCHLKRMDHSKEYWQTLEKYYPDVKGARQYLKTNNFIIKLF